MHFADARAITLKLSQTVRNINVTLVPVQTASLSGSIVPTRASVTVRQLGTDVPATMTTLSGINLETQSTPERAGEFVQLLANPGDGFNPFGIRHGIGKQRGLQLNAV